MNKSELIQRLEMLNQKTNEEWMSGMPERKLRELEFHDKHRIVLEPEQLPQDTYEKIYGNKKFYRTVKSSTDYVTEWIDYHSKGKVFLDYACGNGTNAIRAARIGAELAIGLDISHVSIENARRVAKENNAFENTYFIQGDCEQTGLPDECIDVAVCSGVLHHLDLSFAFFELRRILKIGGIIFALEALDDNPLIKFYRNRTPDMRTDWEKSHILSYKDIRFASRFFDVKNIRHWHLFSIASVYFPFAATCLNRLDKIVLGLPLIKKMSWMFSFEMHKKK